MFHDENDIPAQEKAQEKRTWIQEENEHEERQEDPEEKKGKRQKEAIRIETAGQWSFL